MRLILCAALLLAGGCTSAYETNRPSPFELRDLRENPRGELIATTAAHVHAAADTTSATVAELRPGDRLYAWGATSDEWVRVEVGGEQGYVRRGLVSTARPAPRTAPRSVEDHTALANGMAAGRLRADDINTTGWSAGGLIGGVTLGAIGLAVVYVAADGSDVHPPAVDAHELGRYYLVGFEQGYRERVHEKRKSDALTGGLVGTAVGGIAWLLILSSM